MSTQVLIRSLQQQLDTAEAAVSSPLQSHHCLLSLHKTCCRGHWQSSGGLLDSRSCLSLYLLVDLLDGCLHAQSLCQGEQLVVLDRLEATRQPQLAQRTGLESGDAVQTD